MPKEVKRNVKTYSEGDVQDWLKKLRELPVEIQQKKNDNENLALQKQTNQTQLKHVIEVELAPIKLTIKKIKAQIAAVELPPQIATLESDLPAIEEQLAEKEKIYKKVSQEKTAIDNEVTELRDFIVIRETKSELAKLESSIVDLDNKKFNLEQEHRHNAEEALRIEANYSSLSLDIQAVESQIHATKNAMTSLATSSGAYYSRQTINDGGYSSSQTTNGGGYSSSQTVSNGYTTNQYTSSEAYRNLQRQLENQQRQLTNLQQQRRQLSSQRDGIYDLGRDIDTQLSAIKRSLSKERSRKASCEQTLANYTPQQKLHAEATAPGKLKLKLSEAVDTQEEIHKRYKAADNNLTSIRNKHRRWEEQISSLKRRLNDAHATRGEFASNEDLKDLNEKLENQRQLKAPVVQKRKEIEKKIDNLSDQISSGERKLTGLKDELKREEENTFLQDFTKNPESLYNNLCEQVNKKLDQYDRDYPINQDSTTRLVMHEIRTRLALIATRERFAKSEYSSYLAYQGNDKQNKYIETCGLLHKQLASLRDEKDRHLAELLEEVLQENPLEKNYALTHYLALGLQNCTKEEYEFSEKQQYQTTLSHFKDVIKKLEAAIKDPEAVTSDAEKNLLQASNILIKKIEEHESKPRKDETFDYKYYHNLIQAAENLAYKPKDLAVQRNFQALIQHVDNGKPSIGRQILGVGMMVLGAAVCVGSAFLGMYYVLPKTWQAFAGFGLGVSLIGSGIATFMSGRSHGLHQSFTVYGNATHSSTFFQSAPSAPPSDSQQPVPQQPTPSQQPASQQNAEVQSERLYPEVSPSSLYADGLVINNPRYSFGM